MLDAIDNLSGVGLKVSEEAIRQGLMKAKWPARFEIISRQPMIIFDGAHNPQGIDAATESIRLYFGDEKVIVISGVLNDKDYNRISRSISTIASRVYTITPNNPRALSAKEYANVLHSLGASALPTEFIEEALTFAASEAKRESRAICCLGSLYTYGEIKAIIEGI